MLIITCLSNSSSTAVVRQRPATTSGATVRCMANSRRVKMVSKQIQRELSDMLLTDKVVRFAITDVEVSGDLQVIAILDRIKDKKNDTDDEAFEQSDLSDASQDDRDWEGDDADEDIIYVQ